MRPEATGSSCPVCGSSAADFLFRIQALRYVVCRGCRLIRMSPLIEPAPMGEDYTGFDLRSYREFVRLFRRPQHIRDIRAVLKHAGGGTLLDIGCGTGEFPDVAEAAGFQVFGIEPRDRYFLFLTDTRTSSIGRCQDRSIAVKDGPSRLSDRSAAPHRPEIDRTSPRG